MRKTLARDVPKRKAPRPLAGGSASVTRSYVLRTPEGSTLNLTTTAPSSASMDQSVERFAEAMKRLAKR